MDGVLVDNMDIHREVFALFCARYGVDDWRTKFERVAGMGNDEIMAMLMPAELIAERGIKSLGDEKEALYREVYAATITPIAGLKELLASLKAEGKLIAVGSSGCKENVEFVLNSCGISEYFDALVYSDLVTRCKPDPEIYSMAISLLGLEPKECLIFEDAIAGITAAKRANVAKIIAITTTYDRETLERESDADQIIDRYAEVIGKI